MRTMAKKGKRRQKESRNANRMGGTSSRPDGREDDAQDLHSLRGRARNGSGEPPRRLSGHRFGVQMTGKVSSDGVHEVGTSYGYAVSASVLRVFAKLLGV